MPMPTTETSATRSAWPTHAPGQFDPYAEKVLADLSLDVRERIGSAVPFVLAGLLGIVAGGIAAAVAGPTGWESGSWVAAYLVLALGVGQIGLGVGQATLAATVPTHGAIRAELIAWNVGSLAVVLGTLATSPLVVTSGGVAMMITLVLCAMAIRATRTTYVWAARGYVGLIAILVISIPIGLTLSWLGA